VVEGGVRVDGPAVIAGTGLEGVIFSIVEGAVGISDDNGFSGRRPLQTRVEGVNFLLWFGLLDTKWIGFGSTNPS
jgi:hypothetical protein